MEDRGEQLDAVDHPWPGPHDDRIGIDSPHLGICRKHGTADHVIGQPGGAIESKATRRDEHDLGARRRDRRPLDPFGALPTPAEQAFTAGGRDEIGHPVPGGERRVGPLENEGCRTTSAGDTLGRRVESGTAPLDESGGGDVRPSARADGEDRVEHLVERHRIERQHVGAAPEVGQRVVDLRHIDGAHRAQILGDDELRVEVGEGAAIEAVQVLAGGHPLLDGGVDTGRVEPLRERGRRHDALRASGRREVALERHTDDVVAQPELEQDLGCGREQRDDPHDGDTKAAARRARDNRLAGAVCGYRPAVDVSGSASGQAREIETAPEDDGHAAQRRGLVGRRLFLGALVIFVAAGMVGLLGVHSATVEGSDGPVSASVRFGRIGRGGVAVPYAINVTSVGGFTGPIEITVDQSYLDLFDHNGIEPGPDATTSDGETITWTFDPPPGPDFTVTLDVRIGPSVQWGRTGHTVVEAEGRRIELSHHSWVMP